MVYLGEQRGGWEKCALGWLEDTTCDRCQRILEKGATFWLEKGATFWLEMEPDVILCPDCFEKEPAE